MNGFLSAVVLLGLLASGCGSSSAPGAPGSPMSASGIWSGSATDSSTSTLGSGGMMGQAGMGTMTWQLMQTGSNVAGSVRFSGMPSSMMGGTVSGVMSGEDFSFTMDMPAGSMMSGNCSVHATGTARMDVVSMTMSGSYGGANSCAGAFSNGQMTMRRQ